MKLTGKCKEAFEKWLLNDFYAKGGKPTITQKLQSVSFENHRDSLKWGVYVDFFDSVDIPTIDFNDATYPMKNSQRNKVRKKAINKANEIFNNV